MIVGEEPSHEVPRMHWRRSSLSRTRKVSAAGLSSNGVRRSGSIGDDNFFGLQICMPRSEFCASSAHEFWVVSDAASGAPLRQASRYQVLPQRFRHGLGPIAYAKLLLRFF